ncbi:MAG TPA: dihydroorotate dehydrogenase [Solirubrobacterales bacterium]|nr:dihydroorotate dehydrogenase [Solirubrobacterales bacterium]
MPERQAPPFGRRRCEVVESRASGGYRLFSLLDREGPAPLPGQFYMLAAERRWEERGGRPFLPRALSVAEAKARDGAQRLDFLIEGIGPGTDRLCDLQPGEQVWVNGPLGNSFSSPRDLSPDAAGAILVGGGIGIAPLAILRRSFSERGVPTQILLGFRDAEHSGGLDDLFSCCQIGLASDDGHIGHHGYVTDLLAAMLAGDDATSAAVYACGPPQMLEAVADLCTDRGVACELAHEAPMACGFGACYGCAVPNPGGDGYIRLCVDGPVIRLGADVRGPAGPVAAGDPPPPPVAKASSGAVPPTAPPTGRNGSEAPEVEFCGLKLRHPVVNASGTFDAIAARRVYGDALLREFPFSAFVSKTITLGLRVGNEPQRIWETPAGMINSIGLPNRGLEGFLAQDLPHLAELPVPLIVSVMATAKEDFGRMVAALEKRHEVAAIELNVSCPNVHSGLIVGEQPAETKGLLEALRPLTEKPLIVKLTPNVANPADVAVAAEEGGADAVSLINTLKASAIDLATGKPGIAAGHGGLSGPAVRPVAIAQLRAVTAAVEIPIVGMGGVASGADAGEMLSAGAALVAVGTESFRDPAAGNRIALELSERYAGMP